MEIITVSEIPAHYTLAQNSDDVAELLAYLGTSAQNDGYGYLFIDAVDGEIVGAYGSYTPALDAYAYPIL